MIAWSYALTGPLQEYCMLTHQTKTITFDALPYLCTDRSTMLWCFTAAAAAHFVDFNTILLVFWSVQNWWCSWSWQLLRSDCLFSSKLSIYVHTAGLQTLFALLCVEPLVCYSLKALLSSWCFVFVLTYASSSMFLTVTDALGTSICKTAKPAPLGCTWSSTCNRCALSGNWTCSGCLAKYMHIAVSFKVCGLLIYWPGNYR